MEAVAGRQEEVRADQRPAAGAILATALVVVGINAACSALGPLGTFPQDVFALLDCVWRLAQGQSWGTDFHNPMGFGVFEVASVLWKLTPLRTSTLPIAIGVFSAVIVLCAYDVLSRRGSSSAAILLFCVFVGFLASAPFVHGAATGAGGLAMFYNRLGMAAVAVIFLQMFTAASTPSRVVDVRDCLVAALLLNILFLVKISYFVCGCALVVAGTGLQHRSLDKAARQMLNIFGMLLAFVLLDLVLTGNSLRAVFDDYVLGFQVVSEFEQKFRFDGLLAPVFDKPVIYLAVPMVLCALYDPPLRSRTLHSAALILTYLALQAALNRTNGLAPTFELAVPAAFILWIWREQHRSKDVGPSFQITSASTLTLPSLTATTAALIAALVLAPHVVGTARAAWAVASVYLGRTSYVTLSAGNGVRVTLIGNNDYAAAIPAGLAILQRLGSKGPIATLDNANPFPVLLLAPSPKGIAAWGGWAPAVTQRHRSSVLGDACTVMVPQRPEAPTVSNYLVGAARSELERDFERVEVGPHWHVYQRRGACPPG